MREINVGEIYLDIDGGTWVVTSTDGLGHIINQEGLTINLAESDYVSEYFDFAHCNKYKTWQEAVNSEEFKKPNWSNYSWKHEGMKLINVVEKEKAIIFSIVDENGNFVSYDDLSNLEALTILRENGYHPKNIYGLFYEADGGLKKDKGVWKEIDTFVEWF